MTAAATTARLAAWDAIDNWPALNPGGKSVFRRKIKHEDDPALIPANQPIGIGDLPSIELLPLAENPKWEVNRMQEVPYSLGINLNAKSLEQLEQLIEDTIKAIWQCGPVGTPGMSYVRTATGYLPLSAQTTMIRGPASKEKPGSPKSWGAMLTVLLRFNRDPLGRT